MLRVLRQLAQGVSVLWGSATLVFFIFSQVPDPARAIAGQNERQEAMDAFKRVHGLDLPLGQRYLRFLGELSPWGPQDTGWGMKAPSLGLSYFGERPVVEALMEALPATLLLAVTAMGLALMLGVSLGLALAWRGDGLVARAVIGLATLGMSAPSFFVAILVAWLFGVVWHDVTGLPPSGGWRVLDPFEGPKVAWNHLILPALTLGSLEMTPRPVHGASRSTRSKPPMTPGKARPSWQQTTALDTPRRCRFATVALCRSFFKSLQTSVPEFFMSCAQ